MARSRSRSPYRGDRRGSRSPRRRDDRERSRRKDAGFRWKEKRPRTDYDRPEDDKSRGLDRGYRNSGRDSYKPRTSDARDQDLPRKERVEDQPPLTDTPEAKEKKKEKKKAKKSVIAPPAEPMIIVNVNDRLGTKAAIPCLASDPIRLFKAQVAARIGRQPHEILLKRQGERPFKDQLTLEDYGVSNGVQLDLEVDTGD